MRRPSGEISFDPSGRDSESLRTLQPYHHFRNAGDAVTVNAIILIGIVVATAGIYRSLSEPVVESTPSESTGSTGNSTNARGEPFRNLRWRTAVTGVAGSLVLVFAGLAITGLANAALRDGDPGTPPSTTVFASSLTSSVFYAGACLVLAGAVGAVLALTGRAVVLSMAMLALGAASVFGVSGNVVPAGALLILAGLSGWAFHRQTPIEPLSESAAGRTIFNDRALRVALTDFRRNCPEPFLTAVSVVMFCWLAGSTIQMATLEGRSSATEMNGTQRALPRAAFKVDDSDSSLSESLSSPSMSSSEASNDTTSHDWRLWCAAGLLAVALIPGYSRSAGRGNERDHRDVVPQD